MPRTIPRLLAALLLAAAPASAQLSYTGGLVSQDFNTLPNSGIFAFTGKGPQALDQSPIGAGGAAGWSLYANVGNELSFLVDAGGGSTASAYSYGTPGSPERALGLLAGSRVCRTGLRLINNTGTTITQFTLGYTGEVWRTGGTGNLNQLAFGYRIQSSVFDVDNGSAVTLVPALNFTSSLTSSSPSALNGNLAANRVLISANVTGISWPAGHMLLLRWADSNSTGDDDALAIDDVVFFAPTGSNTPPLVANTIPAAAATGVVTTSRLAVIFDQPVNVAGSWAQLNGAVEGAIPVTIAGGPIRYEITPSVRLQPGQNYTLTVLAAQVTNTAGTPMGSNVVTNFTTQPAITNLQLISAVQGFDVSTPLAGQVVTVRGVVTADFQGPSPGLGGFFIQSLPSDADTDLATSEGLFVYDFSSEGSAPVAVGDVVTLTGTASEFSNQTELSLITSISIDGTAPLPALTDAALPMATSAALEPFEGMRVRFPQTLHVTSTNTSSNFSVNYARQGELILASDGPLVDPTEEFDLNDDPASGTTSTGNSNAAAITAAVASNSLRTLVLDDASTALYPDPTPFLNAQGTRRCGDTVTGLAGILSFTGGRYRLQPTGPVPFVDANPRPLTPPAISGRIKIAAMNVLNYFITFGDPNDRGADNAAEFQRQKDKVIAALAALDADVLGLIEVQNTSAAVTDILTALNAAVGANSYAAVPTPAIGAAGDFIRTVLLYRPSKVSLFGECFADNDIVWNTPNPLRYPLAQVFVENSTGERFIACLNHWKSKSSSGASGANLDQLDGQGAFNDLRRQQAARLHAWLQTVCAAVGDNDVLILGDLNSLGEEDPLDVLRSLGYADQGTRFHSGDYSYRLAETRGRLDHAFATGTMAAQITAVDHWHINADEPAFYDYNLENKSVAQQAVNVGTPFRSSDHDPVLIGVSLAPQPTTYAMWAAARAWPPGAGTQAADDPDNDAMENLEEFALNSDPLVADPALRPVTSFDGPGFRLMYRQRTNAAGVIIQPQWSENLIDWFPMTIGAPAVIDAITQLQSATVPVDGRTRLFGRLEITIVP